MPSQHSAQGRARPSRASPAAAGVGKAPSSGRRRRHPVPLCRRRCGRRSGRSTSTVGNSGPRRSRLSPKHSRSDSPSPAQPEPTRARPACAPSSRAPSASACSNSGMRVSCHRRRPHRSGALAASATSGAGATRAALWARTASAAGRCRWPWNEVDAASGIPPRCSSCSRSPPAPWMSSRAARPCRWRRAGSFGARSRSHSWACEKSATVARGRVPVASRWGAMPAAAPPRQRAQVVARWAACRASPSPARVTTARRPRPGRARLRSPAADRRQSATRRAGRSVRGRCPAHVPHGGGRAAGPARAGSTHAAVFEGIECRKGSSAACYHLRVRSQAFFFAYFWFSHRMAAGEASA